MDEEYSYAIGYDIHQQRGIIINIAKNTTPYSTKGISSGGIINWVLEINGGLSDRMNIKNGDLVSFNLIRDPDEE